MNTVDQAIHLPTEMSFWTSKGMEAIDKRMFQPTVIGYWTPGTCIIREQGSRHFCLAFPPPSDAKEMEGLCVHLKLQLLYNNATAYIYIGAQQGLKGAESSTGLVTIGYDGKDKKCWVTPFQLPEDTQEEVEFFETVETGPKTFAPWDSLYPESSEINPDMDGLIRELHGYLILKDELSESGKEVMDFFRSEGKKNLFAGIPSEEVFRLCVLYIAARASESEFLEGR